MKAEILAPAQFLGDIIGDLNSRRAHIDGIETQQDSCVIHYFIPLGETFGFATGLRSLSQGRATYTMEFCRYEEVPASLTEQITARTKVAR